MSEDTAIRGHKFCICNCRSPMFGHYDQEGVPLFLQPGQVIRGETLALPQRAGTSQVFGFVWLRDKWRTFVATLDAGSRTGEVSIL